VLLHRPIIRNGVEYLRDDRLHLDLHQIAIIEPQIQPLYLLIVYMRLSRELAFVMQFVFEESLQCEEIRKRLPRVLCLFLFGEIFLFNLFDRKVCCRLMEMLQCIPLLRLLNSNKF